MTSLASWTSPNSIRKLLVELVARVPARVQTKLLVAFLTIVGLLIVLGAVGLSVLSGVNDRTDELIKLRANVDESDAALRALSNEIRRWLPPAKRGESVSGEHVAQPIAG